MNSFLNDKAPAKGYILASYLDILVFEPYEIREGKLYFKGIEAFPEEVLVRPQYAERGDLPEKLTIINRYRYSENDTLTLENYRISCNTEKINV